MEEASEIFEAVQDVVFEPDILGALWLVGVSVVGEFVATFPTSFVFTGVLLSFDEGFSLLLTTKIFFLVAVPIGIGTALGSLPHYALAYFGGKPAIEKSKKYTGVSWGSVERLEAKFFNKWYDEVVFLLLRSIPFTPTIPLNILAGVLRMKLSSYIALTVIGISIKMMIMVFVFAFGGGGVLNEILDL